ncbi:hypothetical protein V8B97DRAFT_1136626 [Scleroderma yunnanense]
MLCCDASHGHPPRFERPTSPRRISPSIAPSQPLGYGIDCRAFCVLVMVTQGGVVHEDSRSTSKPYKRGIARANVWPLNKKCSCEQPRTRNQGLISSRIYFCCGHLKDLMSFVPRPFFRSPLKKSRQWTIHTARSWRRKKTWFSEYNGRRQDPGNISCGSVPCGVCRRIKRRGDDETESLGVEASLASFSFNYMDVWVLNYLRIGRVELCRVSCWHDFSPFTMTGQPCTHGKWKPNDGS